MMKKSMKEYGVFGAIDCLDKIRRERVGKVRFEEIK
jgi:hypothetical protein